MIREWHAFLHAVMFLTRIPVPRSLPFDEKQLHSAAKFYPLVGLLVGSLGAVFYWVALWLFPPALAVLASMVATILVTGSFHEDGLADVCDGFGGGWEPKSILRIMKDSRIGTYGVVGLVLTLAIKATSLIHLPGWLVPFALIAAHAWSRFLPLLSMRWGEYVREEGAKVKPMASRISASGLGIALLAGLLAGIPLIFIQAKLLLAYATSTLMAWYLGRYFKKWIGGYTGDCLGAIQQLCETVFYLTLTAVLWKST